MITLFASIVGFIGSIIPEIIKLIKLKKDNEHELKILEKKIELIKANKSVNCLFDDEQFKNEAIMLAATRVDTLNSSVRPVLAYGFFTIYLYIKVIQYCSIGQNFMHYFDLLWTQDDQAAFAAIISFYFGQRTFKRLWK